MTVNKTIDRQDMRPRISMLHAEKPLASEAWRRATVISVLALFAWQVTGLIVVYFLTGGKEFIDDASTYAAYIADPLMLLTERHRLIFGGSVAPPLLPLELKATYAPFASLGDFLALRLTMILHITFALAVGFAAAFRHIEVPRSWREWAQVVTIAIVPVAWITSVVTVQDDTIAAAWGGACLAAFLCLGPLAGAVAAGFGMFFGKIFFALAFLALWTSTPGLRTRLAGIGAGFVLGLLAFLLWRDGGFAYSEYVYPPYVGASPYGIAWLIGGKFDLFAIRNLSAVVSTVAIALFTYVAARRRTSFVSAITALHSLFLVTYFGAMPEYYVWFLPFVVFTLWACLRQGLWGTFCIGWLTTFFAYGYKLLYGMNERFQGTKETLKHWAANNIPFNIEWLLIAVGICAVLCTLFFAISVLVRDPAKTVTEAPQCDARHLPHATG